MKLRNFLLGQQIIESRSEYKYAMLRGQLGLLLGFICFVYIFIDISNGVLVYIPWYLGGIIVSIFAIYQNKRRQYLLASVVLLLGANLLVFLIAALEASQGGAFFYFMATSATGLVVLNPISKRLGTVFVGFSILLAAIAYFGEKPPLPPPEGSENYVKISFTTNFILGLLSCVLVLLFVMRRNQESEASFIANQKKLEALAEELEKSKNRFAMAVDGTKAGIYEWDIVRNKVYVSSRWKNLLGYGDRDKLKVNQEFFKSLVHPDDAKKTMAQMEEAVEKGLNYQNELRMRLKDGSYRWFLDTGIIKKKKDISHVAVGSIIDIHLRKTAEQELVNKNMELEKTNTELDRFVYSASHDMRAPLTTLMGLLNLAKLSNDQKELQTYFDMMTHRINTMEGFIREVTDYSRNARLEIIKEKINLSSLIDSILKSFEFLAAEASVRFEVKVAKNCKIYSDPGRLKVILNNLIANAIKYHDEQKSDRYAIIKAGIEGKYCLIQVIDNGTGIPEEYQDKIFEMFYRASERSDGSGLGLYIVRETLNRLKGSIECHSVEGEGSTFAVRIPANNVRGVKRISSKKKVKNQT